METASRRFGSLGEVGPEEGCLVGHGPDRNSRFPEQEYAAQHQSHDSPKTRCQGDGLEGRRQGAELGPEQGGADERCERCRRERADRRIERRKAPSSITARRAALSSSLSRGVARSTALAGVSSSVARARARSTARARRLLVLSTRMEEALVSTAGATMSDNAAYGLVGSLMPAAWGEGPPEYERSAHPGKWDARSAIYDCSKPIRPNESARCGGTWPGCCRSEGSRCRPS